MKTKTLLAFFGLVVLAALAMAFDHSLLGIQPLAFSLALAPVVLTEEQVKELQTLLSEMKGGWAEVQPLPASVKTLQGEPAQLQQHVADVRRLLAARPSVSQRLRAPGLISEECARHLAAQFIAQCEKGDKLEA